MTTAVDIANIALANLSQHASITALTGASLSPVAQRCAQQIGVARNAVLEASDWGFAREYVTRLGVDLDDGSGAYAFAYQYEFELPADCVRITSVHEWGRPISEDSVIRHRRMTNKKVQVPFQDSILVYVSDGVDYDDWPSEAILAVAAKLSYLIAMPVTKSLKAQQAALEKYVDALRMAIANDAVVERPTPWTERPAALLTARRW